MNVKTLQILTRLPMRVTSQVTTKKKTTPIMTTPKSDSPAGVFVQTFNPMTGKADWVVKPDDYDYQQEVARAAFADMLHDSERVRPFVPFHFCQYYQQFTISESSLFQRP